MNLLENFSILLNQYDDSMFQIFKRIIDDAKTESQERNLDPISTFIFINEKIEYAYIQLAIARGIITKKESYTEGHNKLIISEKLSESIYTYIEPITELARENIKLKAQNILMSTSLEELRKEYNDFFSLLSNKTIQKNPYVYEDIEFKPNVKV